MGLFFKEEKKVAPQKAPVPQVITPDVQVSTDFEDIMEANNQQGPDYLEFCKVLSGLKDLPIDEKQKYLAAFEGFRIQGVSLNDLVTSAKFYLSKFEEENAKFSTELEKEERAKVTNPTARKDALSKENVELLDKLNKNRQEQEEIDKSVKGAKAEIDRKEKEFTNNLNEACASINNRIQKLQTYLNG